MGRGGNPDTLLPDGLRCLCIGDSGCGKSMVNCLETQFEPGSEYHSPSADKSTPPAVVHNMGEG